MANSLLYRPIMIYVTTSLLRPFSYQSRTTSKKQDTLSPSDGFNSTDPSFNHLSFEVIPKKFVGKRFQFSCFTVHVPFFTTRQKASFSIRFLVFPFQIPSGFQIPCFNNSFLKSIRLNITFRTLPILFFIIKTYM